MKTARLAYLWRYRLALGWGAYVGASVATWRLFERAMWSHMLLQFPLLIAAGFALAAFAPCRWRALLAPYNQLGLTGLVLASALTSAWMIPRALDLAVQDATVDLLKLLSLLLAGAALRASWRPAGRTVQAFFLVSWAMMTITVGMLYQDTESRLCSYYLSNDQAIAGTGLVSLSTFLVAAWFVLLMRELID